MWAPLCELCQALCLPFFLGRAWPRQTACGWRLSCGVLNCSSSHLNLEELQSCVTGPCFLWPVQSSLGLALQQSRVFSAA